MHSTKSNCHRSTRSRRGGRLASATPANPPRDKLRGFNWKASAKRLKPCREKELCDSPSPRLRNHSAPPPTPLACQHLGRCRLPRAPHGFPIGESFFRLGGQSGTEPIAQSRGKRIEIRSFAQLTRKNFFRVVVAEGRRSGKGIDDDRGKREIVGGRPLRLAEQLFRRSERRRPRASREVLAGDVCNSEIGNAPPVVSVDQDVLRLQIAVQNSMRVRNDQRVQNLLELWCHFGQRTRTVALDQARD